MWNPICLDAHSVRRKMSTEQLAHWGTTVLSQLEIIWKCYISWIIDVLKHIHVGWYQQLCLKVGLFRKLFFLVQVCYQFCYIHEMLAFLSGSILNLVKQVTRHLGNQLTLSCIFLFGFCSQTHTDIHTHACMCLLVSL